jgi:hypothetical protein
MCRDVHLQIATCVQQSTFATRQVIPGHIAALGPSLPLALESVTAPPVTVTITTSPLGASFGPVTCDGDGDGNGDGVGLVVTEVEGGGSFHDNGVREGWVLSQFNGEDVIHEKFWTIDAMFDTPQPWVLQFKVIKSIQISSLH